jgi:hypothetical protein
MAGSRWKTQIAEIRKRLPLPDPNPVAVIIRSIVDGKGDVPPRTAFHDAFVAAAAAAFAKDGILRRVILDGDDCRVLPNG